MVKSYSIPALAALLLTGSAAATDVSVVGLFGGKAVVTINGRSQKLLREGESTPEGVKLISADSKRALLEIDGKRQSLELGQGISVGGVSDENDNASVVLVANSAGHFFANGTINGNVASFVVDTGATMVAISAADARRMGVQYKNGQRILMSTANGVIPVYRVSLGTVKVGGLVLHGVAASVHETALPVILLGMSFLNRVDMKREGSKLTLTKRF